MKTQNLKKILSKIRIVIKFDINYIQSSAFSSSTLKCFLNERSAHGVCQIHSW